MKRTIIMAALMITTLLPVAASTDKAKLFTQANAYYNQASFDSAIQLYEQLAQQLNVQSADVYFNLANAYFRTNKIPQAILNYERALLIAPGRDDIQYNLMLANSKVSLRIEAIPEIVITKWLKIAAHWLQTDGWAWTGVAFFWIFLISMATFVFSSRLALRKVALLTAFAGLFLTATSFSLSYVHKKELQARNYAIVFDDSIVAKSSPDIKGTSLFPLSEGIKVKIQSISGEWVEIRLADGQVGWLPAASLVII